MLYGEEVDGPGSNQTTRTNIGKLKTTSHMLMLHLGKVVRVLRGSGLSSTYAPEGGIRYDGL